MPFERGGLPGILLRKLSPEKRVNQVGEEEKLGGSKEDGRPGDEAVEGQGSGEEMSRDIGNSGELSVVARLAHESSEVHGEKSGVGSRESGAEVEAAESFGH